jgi:hypothetical protein
MMFPGDRAGPATLHLSDRGAWVIAGGRGQPDYLSQVPPPAGTKPPQAPACTALAASSGAWREEGAEGRAARILTLGLAPPTARPLYYRVTGAPLDTVRPLPLGRYQCLWPRSATTPAHRSR